MKHLKLLEQCMELRKEYFLKINHIEKTIYKIEKNSTLLIKCCNLTDTGMEFSIWSDRPNHVNLTPKNFNSVYGLRLTRTSARKIRNFLNIFLGDVK